MRLPRVPTKRASQANRTGKGCHPAAGPAVSVARLAQGKRSAKTAEAVRKRPGRGTEEAREPVGTRQDRTLLPVPDALRTTFRKRDFRAFAREHVSTDRRNRHSGALPGNMSEGLRKKTGQEIWPRVCLKTGAQALLLLSGTRLQPVARIWASVLCDCHLLIFSDGF